MTDQALGFGLEGLTSDFQPGGLAGFLGLGLDYYTFFGFAGP